MITGALKQAVFTGGCFWTLEAVFRRLKGVKSVESGYVWMKAGLPPEESLARHKVEKMEGVWVQWDSNVISLEILTEVLLSITSPSLSSWETLSEMSGARSAIFVSIGEDIRGANAAIERKKNSSPEIPVYTQVISWLPGWQAAANFDVDYFEKNPAESFCRSIVMPKLERVAARFEQWWQPV